MSYSILDLKDIMQTTTFYKNHVYSFDYDNFLRINLIDGSYYKITPKDDDNKIELIYAKNSSIYIDNIYYSDRVVKLTIINFKHEYDNIAEFLIKSKKLHLKLLYFYKLISKLDRLTFYRGNKKQVLSKCIYNYEDDRLIYYRTVECSV